MSIAQISCIHKTQYPQKYLILKNTFIGKAIFEGGLSWRGLIGMDNCWLYFFMYDIFKIILYIHSNAIRFPSPFNPQKVLV